MKLTQACRHDDRLGSIWHRPSNFEKANQGQACEIQHLWPGPFCKQDSALNITFSLSIRKHSSVIGVVGKCDEVPLVSFIGFCKVNTPRVAFSKLYCHECSLCVITTDASIVCHIGRQSQSCVFLQEKGNFKYFHRLHTAMKLSKLESDGPLHNNSEIMSGYSTKL